MKFLIFIFPTFSTVFAQENEHGWISGNIKLDTSWDNTIYLSHISRFEDLYRMTGDMIIARTPVDSIGNFKLDIDFLSEKDNLFRLHLAKKGDTPASLIIGGKDENHLFLIANRYSKISLAASSVNPPFTDARFFNSSENQAFQYITQLVADANELADKSTSAKRRFIESNLSEQLMTIADSSSIPLVSLYALYKNQIRIDDESLAYYENYLQKWNNQNNTYFEALRNQIPVNNGYSFTKIILIFISIGISIPLAVYLVAKMRVSGVQKLSVQERKIYELLRRGASNQEISDHCNIGISTVKSHVSNIFTKLKVKSRKDLMDIR